MKKIYVLLIAAIIVFLPTTILANEIYGNILDNDTMLSLSTNFFGNLDAVKCGNAQIPAPIPPIIRTIVNIIKIATPIVLIIMGMLDMLKAVTASDENKLKDAQNKFIKRLIPAVLVFLVISIVQFLVSIVDDNNSAVNCISCLIGNSKSCIKVEITDTPSDNPNVNSGNTNDSKSYITSIKNDGPIITIKTKNNSGIKGYYFSYSSKRPKKEKGGYLETNKTTIDVVRLPGTTYVWVEDSKGNISKAETIKIDNNVLLKFSKKNYKTLQGTSLSDYLKSKGWSVKEYNKLIARSIRANGLFNKESAAVAAVSLQGVLGQKYGIKLPYKSAGIYRKFGINPLWGKSSNSYNYGMDCSAFVTWTYVQAGWDISKLNPPYWSGWPTVEFSKKNGEIGDVLVLQGEQGSRHVKLIIGKTNNAFIIAEASQGLTIGTHSYSSSGGYRILKGETFNSLFDFVSESSYPTGF